MIDGQGDNFEPFSKAQGASEQSSEIRYSKDESAKDEHLFVCSICDKSFQTKHDLDVHCRRGHMNKFVCGLCGQDFNTKAAFTRHKNFTHRAQLKIINEKLFFDPNATPRAQEQERLNSIPSDGRDKSSSPSLVETEDKKMKCRSCQTWFTTIAYVKHMQSAHNVTASKGETFEPSEELILTCTLCPERFATCKERDHHARDHHNFMDLTCDFCYKTFNTIHGRMMHIRSHFVVHPETLTPIFRPSKSKVAFRCAHCTQSFTSTDKLDMHMYVYHTKLLEASKSKVPGTFYNNNVIMVSGEESSTKCDFCSVEFPSKEKLFEHLDRRHFQSGIKTENTPQSCDSCNEVFKGSNPKQKLIDHIKTTHYGLDSNGKTRKPAPKPAPQPMPSSENKDEIKVENKDENKSSKEKNEEWRKDIEEEKKTLAKILPKAYLNLDNLFDRPSKKSYGHARINLSKNQTIVLERNRSNDPTQLPRKDANATKLTMTPNDKAYQTTHKPQALQAMQPSYKPLPINLPAPRLPHPSDAPLPRLLHPSGAPLPRLLHPTPRITNPSGAPLPRLTHPSDAQSTAKTTAPSARKTTLTIGKIVSNPQAAGSNVKFLCSVCHKPFDSQTMLVNHSMTHIKKNFLDANGTGRIDLPQQTVATEATPAPTVKVENPDDSAQDIKPSIQIFSPETAVCPFCLQQFESASALFKHRSERHSQQFRPYNETNREYKCDSCYQMFNDPIVFQRHILTFHFGMPEQKLRGALNYATKRNSTSETAEAHVPVSKKMKT